MTQQIYKSISFYSLNTRGLGTTSKRVAIFLWLKQKGEGIYLLQETHSTCNIESKWTGEWGGKIFFSHGESNARGVAILVTKNLYININSTLNDTNGRFILLDCTIGNQNLIIVNLYAPTLEGT